jgi:hypothetical protein
LQWDSRLGYSPDHLIQFSSIAIVIAVLATTGCKDVRRGQSSANETPVADGRVVLLKRNKEVAAFIMKNQRLSPELTDFYWCYRNDGKGTFPPADPALSSGFVSNTSRVAFATFSVPWSINSNGMGWLYFSKGPTER